MDNFNPLDHFDISENSLSIGNFNITEIKKLGYSTPIYIYSKEVIRKKIKILRDLLSADFKIYYSIKANPFKDLISYTQQYVDGFDVSSIHELNLALATGISGKNICYTGPGKNESELQAAIESDVLISAESKLETEKIKRKAETNKRVNILNQATDNCLSTDVPDSYTNELYKDKRERPETQPRVNP